VGQAGADGGTTHGTHAGRRAVEWLHEKLGTGYVGLTIYAKGTNVVTDGAESGRVTASLSAQRVQREAGGRLNRRRR
jgi:hypothetical protein